jgi:hypothetical protein
VPSGIVPLSLVLSLLEEGLSKKNISLKTSSIICFKIQKAKENLNQQSQEYQLGVLPISHHTHDTIKKYDIHILKGLFFNILGYSCKWLVGNLKK